MARFKVNYTQKDEDTFILQGNILTGQILPGMQIHAPLNSSLCVTGDITAIKETDRMDHYDIFISCSDPEEMNIWYMLNLTGYELEIV
ncbi:hypothetical protein B5M42_020845 [Paenibacillus athensensis]|nr:hypothetical protein [Paenibacillus athensensis]MCD1261252.1 hypothetical protein [Paenibacillus athensensis]